MFYVSIGFRHTNINSYYLAHIARNSSETIIHSPFIKELILERNHTNVRSVVNSLDKVERFIGTKELTNVEHKCKL